MQDDCSPLGASVVARAQWGRLCGGRAPSSPMLAAVRQVAAIASSDSERDAVEPKAMARAQPPDVVEMREGMQAARDVQGPLARRRLHAFCGALYRSPAHMQYLLACRARRREERKREQSDTQLQPLQQGWNAERLRIGDHVGQSQGSDLKHPNSWSIRGVLRAAWQQVGRAGFTRHGTEGSHKSLQIVSTVAGVVRHRQQEFLRQEMDKIGRAAPVFTRMYDCTPTRFHFGQLQPMLAPMARYLVKDGLHWKPVPCEEFMRREGCRSASTLRSGVLDVMAHGVSCAYVDRSGPLPVVAGFRDLCHPLILENGTGLGAPHCSWAEEPVGGAMGRSTMHEHRLHAASVALHPQVPCPPPCGAPQTGSCIYRALQDNSPEMSLASIARVANEAPFVLVQDIPDACSANQRAKEHTFEELPSNAFAVDVRCAAHQAHRIVASSEKEVIGDLHAVHVTCSHVANSARMAAGLQALLARDLEYIHGEPPHEWTVLNRLIARHTLLRKAEVICSECSDDGSILESEDSRRLAVMKFLSFWNGNWRGEQIQHWCSGCCTDVGEAQQRLYASAIEVNLLQSKDIDTPSIDDWGTCGAACGVTSAGILIHNILSRVVREALPSAAYIPELPNDIAAVDDAQLLRIKAQKKACRAKQFLESDERRMRCLLVNWLAAPIERLMSGLQYRDARHNGLLDAMQENLDNPFTDCKHRLCVLLKLGKHSTLKGVFAYFPAHQHGHVRPLSRNYRPGAESYQRPGDRGAESSSGVPPGICSVCFRKLVAPPGSSFLGRAFKAKCWALVDRLRLASHRKSSGGSCCTRTTPIDSLSWCTKAYQRRVAPDAMTISTACGGAVGMRSFAKR